MNRSESDTRKPEQEIPEPAQLSDPKQQQDDKSEQKTEPAQPCIEGMKPGPHCTDQSPASEVKADEKELPESTAAATDTTESCPGKHSASVASTLLQKLGFGGLRPRGRQTKPVATGGGSRPK